MNWFQLLFTGKAVYDIVVNDLPKAMEDSKLSLEEIVNIIVKIAAVFSYKIEFSIPKEIKTATLDVISFTKNV